MAQQHRQLATAPQQQRPNAAFRQCCQAVDQKTAASLAAAAVVLQSCLLGSQAVAAVPVSSGSSLHQQQQQAWQPVIGDMSLTAAAQAPAVEEADDENLQEIEDDIMAQVAIPQELTDFMQMLQKVRRATGMSQRLEIPLLHTFTQVFSSPSPVLGQLKLVLPACNAYLQALHAMHTYKLCTSSHHYPFCGAAPCAT